MSDLLASTRCLANLPPIAPRWLWPGRIPRGKIILLAGPSGSGKTFIALDIAARITTGTPFPDIGAASSPDPLFTCSPPGAAAAAEETKTCNLEPKTSESPDPLLNCSPVLAAAVAVGSVLLITPEHDLIDNIRLRLEAAHANVDKIIATTELPLDKLRNCVDCIEDLKLIIIDPLSFLVTNDNESGFAAQKLFNLYQHLFSRSISILALLPMNSGRADPLHRIPGINSLASLASTIFAVSPDHREENTQTNRRVLIQLKNSLSPLAPALALNIEDGALSWSEETLPDQNIEEIIATPRRKSGPDPLTLDQCTQWLYEFLTPNPRLQSEVVAASAAAGFSYTTLRRAKEELKVQSKHEKDGHWLWRVPPGTIEYDEFDKMTDRMFRII